jgi:GTPase
MFVDSVKLTLRGGNGGAGVSSFLRRKGLPKGKPNGGSGGSGGDVILVADPNVPTLLRYERHPVWKAPSGTHGEGELRHGKRGDSLVLPVPLGTIVRDAEGVLVADLVEAGQSVVAARGGKGGKGNAAFVSPSRKAPTFAEQGEYGEETEVVLELKLLADAAIVGYPNAGKSTLISRLSAAKPKIADYPFTTLVPQLGVVVRKPLERSFVIADLPGLIAGAAQGAGLGIQFLRHVERCRILLHLVDLAAFEGDAADDLETVERELAAFDPSLMARVRLVVGTKLDSARDERRRQLAAAADARALPHFEISSATGAGIERLVRAIAERLEESDRETA